MQEKKKEKINEIKKNFLATIIESNCFSVTIQCSVLVKNKTLRKIKKEKLPEDNN